jgi:AcrR family transcriptional regulator
MSQKRATRQAILEGAVTCIEKYGMNKITTRRIAAEAGTNLASINYHFRSKAALMDEVMTMTINHMLQDVLAAVDAPGEAFDTTLGRVIFYLLDGSLRFPGISKAHLSEAVAKGPSGSVSGRAMSRVFEGLADRAIGAYPREDSQRIRLRVSQIMSSILFTVLNPRFFRTSQEYRLTTTRNVQRVAECYVELFVSGLQSSSQSRR